MKNQNSRQRRGSLASLELERSGPRAAKLKAQKYRKGFTLIEMLVVVVVFGLGVVGAFSFFNMNLNNQFEVKNELIAAGLAQEGVDLVRNIRDYNLVNSATVPNWYNNLHDNSNIDLTRSCVVDFTSLASHSCPSETVKVYVCFDTTSKRYYQCSNSSDTGFKRTISITRQGGDLGVAGNWLKVVCKVEWNGHSTIAEDALYDNVF